MYRRKSDVTIDHHECDRDGSTACDCKSAESEQGAVLSKLGAEVVYPERDMALRLGKKLLSNNFLEYVSLCNQVEIRQIEVPNHLIGKSIEETEIRQKYRLNIIAIENGDETNIEVMPEYRLRQGDIIVVIGKVDNIDVFVNEAKAGGKEYGIDICKFLAGYYVNLMLFITVLLTLG